MNFDEWYKKRGLGERNPSRPYMQEAWQAACAEKDVEIAKLTQMLCEGADRASVAADKAHKRIAELEAEVDCEKACHAGTPDELDNVYLSLRKQAGIV